MKSMGGTATAPAKSELRLSALLRGGGAVRLLDDDAGAGRQPVPPLRRLGRRRPVQLSADRLLVHQAVGGGRGPQGVPGHALGDVGLFLGILLLWLGSGGHLDFESIFREFPQNAGGHREFYLTLALSAAASAGRPASRPSFRCYVWLPDAMEGPTPVSALIHAATMVTAGVYLVARCTPLFVQAPDAQLVVACIGCFTALLAALIALTQNDLKRVLAYSTLSQLGYMFLGLGCGVGDGGRPARSPSSRPCSTCSRTPSSRRCCSSRPAA